MILRRRPRTVPMVGHRDAPPDPGGRTVTAALVGLLILLCVAVGVVLQLDDGDAAASAAGATSAAESAAGAQPEPVASPVPTAEPTRVPSPAVPPSEAAVPPEPAAGAAPQPTVAPPGPTPQDLAAGVLALDVPASASGVLDVVPGAEAAPGAGPVRTVRVEVEQGLPVDPVAFAATVMATLNDPRGWGAGGEMSFARTDGPADIRVVLASPALVDALCAPLPTRGETSCGRNGHAALNLRRWVHATEEFADRTQYRQYLVNHEVGHLLGRPHEKCPGAGAVAPIMQQQTLQVAPCVPNGWPYPQG